MTATREKIRRLPPEDRLRAASAWIGHRAEVDVERSGNRYTFAGTVIATATAPNGGTADLLIFEKDHPDPERRYVYPASISLATVIEIRKEEA